MPGHSASGQRSLQLSSLKLASGDDDDDGDGDDDDDDDDNDYLRSTARQVRTRKKVREATVMSSLCCTWW